MRPKSCLTFQCTIPNYPALLLRECLRSEKPTEVAAKCVPHLSALMNHHIRVSQHHLTWRMWGPPWTVGENTALLVTWTFTTWSQANTQTFRAQQKNHHAKYMHHSCQYTCINEGKPIPSQHSWDINHETSNHFYLLWIQHEYLFLQQPQQKSTMIMRDTGHPWTPPFRAGGAQPDGGGRAYGFHGLHIVFWSISLHIHIQIPHAIHAITIIQHEYFTST